MPATGRTNASAFPGFPPQALSFFRQLEKNNRRDWFQPRKPAFDEQVRGPMLDLVALLNDDLRGFAADYVVEPPAKALYRIHRDTRFAKDKSPYKTHIAATFTRPGLPRNNGAGFYVAVSHAGVEVAGGMYMPGPDELAAVRRAIADDDGAAFRALVADRALRRKMGELLGERLARVPKGFPADAPAGDLLRLKQFYFFVMLPADTALTPALRREVASRFRLVSPLVHWLNDAALAGLRAESDEPTATRPPPMF